MFTQVSFRNRILRRATSGQQRGVSVMSVLLGLAIAAAVAAVIYNQYNDSKRKSRIEAAQSEIATIIAGVQKLYGNANQYGAVTTAIAVQSGVVPTRLRVAGTNTAQNVYNGVIEFTPATITSPNDSMTVTYGGVRQEDCQDLVLGSDTMTRRMAVGATVVKAADVAVDVSALAQACDSNSTNDINFTFGRGQ
ncbi:type 4 pilus major pilin [Variovorax sp. SRS16]|uniref:type 4 pilus major pilin n=1 Tax=Variovorax sp. SRS16 TaxID=282217 RepID=UPI0013A592E5|nr:type 4 pilus major pilin [Variovorax sp. SRS16]